MKCARATARFMLICFTAAIVLVGRASAQCPSGGDCRTPHETPGCEMPECCGIVCALNPLCCEIIWDQACADAAIDGCDGINCPAVGLCTEAHPTPGCSDFQCCELVSSIDGWCSWASWDELCARMATQVCGQGMCPIDVSGAIDEAEPCYQRLSDGCGIGYASGRIVTECGVSMKGRVASGGPRDLEWFAMDGVGRRRVRLTLEAEFPVELQYFRGDCEGPNEVKWLIAPALCTGALSLNFIVDNGASSMILGAGNSDESLRNGLDCDEINPDNPPQPDDPPPEMLFGARWRVRVDCLAIGDIDGNGTVGPQDVATLLNAWGAVAAGFAFDPRAIDADLDGNGVVGAPDIAVLFNSW